MKKAILSLIALSAIGSLALPVQAQSISSEKNSVETENVNLKNHQSYGRNGGYRKCYYDYHQHKKVCYWVRHEDHHGNERHHNERNEHHNRHNRHQNEQHKK